MAKSMKKRVGRPKKPLAMHLINGTYRADRHGPLAAAKTRAAVVAELDAAAAKTARQTAVTTIPDVRDGAWLKAEVVAGWRVEDVAGLLALDAAVVALDRIRTIDGYLDAAIPAVVSGQMHSRILDALTKTRTAAVAELDAALTRLDLEGVIASAYGVAS
jgi:hypothetical protein